MATEYLTDSDFLARLAGDLSTRSEPGQRELALNAAAAEADAYLSTGGYTVPVVDPPDNLRRRVADMAAWQLAVILRLVPEPAKDSSLYLNDKAAREWLEDVAQGSVLLSVEFETAGETPGAPAFATNARRRWEDGW